jgi:hypothetical protein
MSHNWQALIRALSSENALHTGYIIGETIRGMRSNDASASCANLFVGPAGLASPRARAYLYRSTADLTLGIERVFRV